MGAWIDPTGPLSGGNHEFLRPAARTLVYVQGVTVIPDISMKSLVSLTGQRAGTASALLFTFAFIGPARSFYPVFSYSPDNAAGCHKNNEDYQDHDR